MKKLLLFLSLFLIIPAWALCPVDGGESVCSLPDASQSSSGMPLFQQNNTEENSAGGLNNSANTIRPTGLTNPFSKTQNQSGIHMQGSLGCQFGNCNKGANNDFLENQ